MNAVRPSAPVSTRRKVAGRLEEAMDRFPRALFGASQATLRDSPRDLTVITMLEALELTGTEHVLEIGSPTAYTAALLSHLAAEVYSVVSEPELANGRREELHALGCSNVHVVFSAPEAGWPAGAPYQAILVGAAATQVPLALIHQLDLGGRLVISIGDEKAQLLERLHLRQGALDSETLGACHLNMLDDVPPPPASVPWTQRSSK